MILPGNMTPTVDLEMGIVVMGIETALRDLREFLWQNADDATKSNRTFEKTRDEYEGLIGQTKRTLRLRMLNKDNMVSKTEMVSCCRRLLNFNVVERPVYMHGLSLIVSDRYEFVDVGIGGVIHIPWNWSSEE